MKFINEINEKPYLQEVSIIETIKNANGKTVCHLDSLRRTIEIVNKGFKTVIQFQPDGTIHILNTKVT